jgi:hypothetical protein
MPTNGIRKDKAGGRYASWLAGCFFTMLRAKVNFQTGKGYPDLGMFCISGRFLIVEIKQPKA